MPLALGLMKFLKTLLKLNPKNQLGLLKVVILLLKNYMMKRLPLPFKMKIKESFLLFLIKKNIH